MRVLRGLQRRAAWLVLLVAGFAWGAPPWTILVDTQNPPFMYANGGRAEGLYPDLLRAIFARLGEPVSVQAKPWRRALAEAEAGQGAIGGLYQTEARLTKFDFSGPVFVERIKVYSKTSKPLMFREIADLKGQTVGVIRGWSYGDAFDAARNSGLFIADEADSDQQNFAKLRNGRVDVVLAIDEAAAAALVAPSNDIYAAEVPLAENPVYLAFAKRNAQTKLLRRFDAALAAMKASGEYQRLVTTRLGSPHP